jgi:hypothetical protein
MFERSNIRLKLCRNGSETVRIVSAQSLADRSVKIKPSSLNMRHQAHPIAVQLTNSVEKICFGIIVFWGRGTLSIVRYSDKQNVSDTRSVSVLDEGKGSSYF